MTITKFFLTSYESEEERECNLRNRFKRKKTYEKRRNKYI